MLTLIPAIVLSRCCLCKTDSLPLDGVLNLWLTVLLYDARSSLCNLSGCKENFQRARRLLWSNLSDCPFSDDRHFSERRNVLRNFIPLRHNVLRNFIPLRQLTQTILCMPSCRFEVLVVIYSLSLTLKLIVGETVLLFCPPLCIPEVPVCPLYYEF